ncbi:hypothetical protein [Brevibacillus gelatini]|uniref:hypothetical protein n=1 Tax=Brevibacillus gelatini TaxID=1655277 RepID=UPI0014755433|nr:hypothetical protein [Brevibacillus gelatini]
MTKDKYVLNRVKMAIYDNIKQNKTIDSYILSELIEQWEFDYDLREECLQQEMP